MISFMSEYPATRGFLLSRSCGACRDLAVKFSPLERAAKFSRRNTCHASEYLGEMARARVTDIQRDLDETARRLADQLLGAGDSFAGDELMRGHAGRLLE